MTDLLSVDAAKQLLLANFSPITRVSIDLSASLDYVIAEDVHSTFDTPPFSNSSMDGFAVRFEDTIEASLQNPVTLFVVEDIPAGKTPQIEIQHNHSSRIMTGAQIPLGANAIVPIENTDAQNLPTGLLHKYVKIYEPALSGDFIRKAGQDIKKGEIALLKGQKIRPQELGLLASFGITKVLVYKKPRIAYFSSGNELINPHEPLDVGKIYNSNAFTLSALTTKSGGELINLGISRDDPESIRDFLDQALQLKVDFILTSAGVSVGAYDFIRDVIKERGKIHFWKVNMRPGKPIAFGNIESVPIIGLPGNPVSSFVTFLVFVDPVIQKLSGISNDKRKIISAELTHNVRSDGRESYLRAYMRINNGKAFVSLIENQGSGNQFGLARSNALLIVPSGVKSLPAGHHAMSWWLD